MAEASEPVRDRTPEPLSPSHSQDSTTLSPSAIIQNSLEHLDLQHHGLPARYSDLEASMFEKIVATRCPIKSQQRGEPELAEAQLFEELYDILCQKPGLFLMRFGKHLDESHLGCFEGRAASDYEVAFRLKALRKNLERTSKACSKAVKNRRYVCLEELMNNSKYFSEEEMQQREPLLFEYYIGQFLSEEEALKIGENKSEMKLSSMIIKNMEVDKRMELLRRQKREEADQLEESDSSSEEDEAMDSTERGKRHLAPMELSVTPETATRERLMLRREFLSVVQARFLEGKDEDFDYSTVDHNEQYDSLNLRERDIEDDYFDTEDPTWCELETGGVEDEGNVSTSADELVGNEDT